MSHRSWHALTVAEVEQTLETDAHGLSAQEAAARLARYGPNALPEPPGTGWLTAFGRQFASPLVVILIIAGGVTVAMGEYIDSTVIALVVLLNATIGFLQERHAEESVRLLRHLLAPICRVVRGKQEWEIPSRELVPGDLVLLESGDRVPADLRLLAANTLFVNESLLTGESLPVMKSVELVAAELAVADRSNMTYAGTMISTGRGRGYVVATGGDTELGAIASEMRDIDRAPTPLEMRMARFARIVGVVVTGAAAAAFALGLAIDEPPDEMFMTAVALAVATVPEGLPVAFTITMAIGVRRMAQRNVIVRRLPSVETLGSTTVIGSDKTGTLTLNEMTVQAIWTDLRTIDLAPGDDQIDQFASEPLRLTLTAGIVASEADVARHEDGGISVKGDPTEAALVLAAVRFALEPEEVRSGYSRYAEIPFEPERQFSAVILEREGRHVTFAKGAPERMLAMSDRMLTSSGIVPIDRDVVHIAANRMAERGLRVLAMAYRPDIDPPTASPNVPDPTELIFLGLEGMADPPRPGAADAIASCRSAGIRITMITGDHAATARAIGAQLGIAGTDTDVVTGAQLSTLDQREIRAIVENTSIYARIAPEQKLEIVRALQANGHIVAITGDGVNDAPALKAADIGIAMGLRGTDVAKEAADMVLADDNFVSITAAIEAGRTTFANIRNTTFFLLSTNGGELITILLSLGLRWEIPLLAVQILWLNLVTDSLQAIGLAFEPGSPATMRRPPRPVGEGLLPAILWERIGLSGVVMAAFSLGIYRWELNHGSTLETARTITLTTMVLFQTFQAANARSASRSILRMNPLANPVLLIGSLAALLCHAIALYLPPTQYLLRIEPIGVGDWARAVACASTILVAVELHKVLRKQVNRETASGDLPATPR